jgi:hypothetical protein
LSDSSTVKGLIVIICSSGVNSSVYNISAALPVPPSPTPILYYFLG